ncbi:hypothetical protein GCM10027566_26230 [Arachidicoccus ginsenosidivorans]
MVNQCYFQFKKFINPVSVLIVYLKDDSIHSNNAFMPGRIKCRAMTVCTAATAMMALKGHSKANYSTDNAA